MDTPTTEAPVTSAPADLSLADIIASAVAEADAAGAETVVTEVPETGDTPAAGTPASDEPEKEEVSPPADDKPADDVSAARARKILAKAEEREAGLDKREAAILVREQSAAADMIAELAKAPKAFLAKHGKSIDDLIDASIAEGKVEAPEPRAAESAEVAELKRRLDARERADADARVVTAVNARMAEIHGAIAASKSFPLVNELKRASVVTDVMLAYHEQHGKPISWDRAAALVEADLKAIRGTSAAPAPAATPTPRPGTTTLAGATATTAQVDDDAPEDPRQLIAFYAKKAGVVA